MIFFPIVLLIMFILPKKIRHIWLLGCSYYFYMCWNPYYIVLIFFSTVATYICGLLLDNKKENNKRKCIMIACIAINLAILFFFKYFDFALENINVVLKYAHLTPVKKGFDVLLPVGISFYTFQALSYVIDVYRGDIKAEKNFLYYALFVSFFPQLVAGPIERSGRLLGQLKNIHVNSKWDYQRIKAGAMIMAWGFFLKLMLADRVAIVANEVFDNVHRYGTIALIMGALAFSLQIYFDFSSYSLIAIGAAKIIGVDLCENFNTPYFAVSIKDFWRRWHISLSSWLRDYLYIPLGGSRCSRARRYINLMVTFLVSGLWHGAAWTYVVWGGLHGLFQILEDSLAPLVNKFNEIFETKTNCFSYKILGIIRTYILVTVAWIFFRAESIRAAIEYIKRMVIKWDPWVLTDNSIYDLGLDYMQVSVLSFCLLMVLAVSIIRRLCNKKLDEFLLQQNGYFQWLYMFAIIMSIIVFGMYGISNELQNFIYFQF